MRSETVRVRIESVAVIKKCLAIVAMGIIASGLGTASEADYQEGVKALRMGNTAVALTKLESAVSGDPENRRFASDYRQAVIQANAYDRCLEFFKRLTEAHPQSANAHLNYGFAYVDKIPTVGSITHVILAHWALNEFTKAVNLNPDWLAYYTRGHSYLYWPKEFGLTHLGVEDLDKAMAIQQADQLRSYYVRTYVALGDGYWKMDNLAKAQQVWRAGLEKFPQDTELRDRIADSGDKLKALIEDSLDPNKRVDTNLKDLWGGS
jgi:tetratricopeptide (TPR) repeat protein